MGKGLKQLKEKEKKIVCLKYWMNGDKGEK